MNTLTQQILHNLEQLPELLQIEALDFVTFLKAKQERTQQSSSVSQTPCNGRAIVAILERMAARKALSEMTDPSAWQREIRQDRPLPGRGEDALA